jgi:DNA mismatch endonuclease, patch repair protein
MDDVDPIRSRIMSSIRSRDTGPEMILRKALFADGYRFRVDFKGLPGRPDIVFTERKIAIFVNGCFWHRHGCPKSSIPKTRSAFWEEKFRRNVNRDAKNYQELEHLGWSVAVIWECEIASKFDLVLNRIELILGDQKRSGDR